VQDASPRPETQGNGPRSLAVGSKRVDAAQASPRIGLAQREPVPYSPPSTFPRGPDQYWIMKVPEMTEEGTNFLDESESRRVWEKAARLQAEASSEGGGPPAEGIVVSPRDGRDVRDVLTAGEEAGIERRFLDAALNEVRSDRVLPAPPRNRHWAARFFGGLLDVIEARQIIEASPEQTLSTLLEQFSAGFFGLSLNERIGDPLDSGVLVFDIEGLGSLNKPWLAREVSASAVRQVYVSIRELDEAPLSCEVTLRGPIAWSHNTGLVHGLLVTTLTGGIGGTTVGALAAAALGGFLMTPLGLTVAGVSAGTGLILGGGLGRNGYRAFCRYGIERARRALEKALVGIAVRAEQDCVELDRTQDGDSYRP